MKIKNLKLISILTFTCLCFSAGAIDFNSARDVLQRNNCFDCHNAANPGRGNFQDYTEEDFISNSYIVPGNSTESLLIQRLKNNGGNMPPGTRPELSEADNQTLKDWITNISTGSTEVAWSTFQSQDPFLASVNNDLIFIPNSDISLQVKTYAKCFRQLTRQEILSTDSTLNQIKAGTLSGIQGCQNLLNRAKLTENGQTEIDKSDPMALDILDTLHNSFHSSWMPTRSHNNISNSAYNRHQNSLYELNAPANYLTYALLSPTGKPRDILTLDKTLQGVRFDLNLTSKSYVRKGTGLIDNFIFADIPASVLHMEEGIITGIKFKDETAVINRDSGPSPLFESYGAGLLEGSYFMLRGGSYIQGTPNGALNVARTTIKNMLLDLLDRSLPLVRIEDVISHNLVHPTAESPLSFRNSTSCMACHATMDPMAHTLRNIRVVRNNNGTGISSTDNSNVSAIINLQSAVTLPAENLDATWNDTAISSFGSRPANGKLFYRDYKGELINEQILGISALGEHFANRLDFYMNISNQYLFWLTGTKAYLGDLGGTSTPNLSLKDLKLRKMVIWLATNLRNDQDMTKLIMRIMTTKLYLGLD